MQKMADPARSLDRARETWKKHGRSEKWIQQRMMGQESRIWGEFSSAQRDARTGRLDHRIFISLVGIFGPDFIRRVGFFGAF
jgi:midasin (ATPase involved in ribosome maturation)